MLGGPDGSWFLVPDPSLLATGLVYLGLANGFPLPIDPISIWRDTHFTKVITLSDLDNTLPS